MAAQEIREHFRQVLGDRRGVAQQPHLTFDALRVIGKVLLHAFGLLQKNARMAGEGFAGRRRGDATPTTFEEFSAQRGFHRADSSAGGGEGQVAAGSAGGDVAGVENV